jgi:hypothetical protein
MTAGPKVPSRSEAGKAGDPAATGRYRGAKAHSGRLGQVVQEVQASMLGGVLIVKRLEGIAAPVHLRTQPHGLLTQRIGAVATVYLNVQQGQV